MKHKILIAAAVIITGIAQAQVPNGLVTEYSFNSGNAHDEKGTNHLSVQNGATFGNDRFGNSGHAIMLDGIDDYLKTTTAFFYPGQPLTISIWFKSASSTQSAQTFFNTDPHTLLTVGYNWYGDGTFDAGLGNGSSWNTCSSAPNGLDTFSAAGVNATNWNHFVMTYQFVWSYYLNNVLVNSCSGGTPANTISNLYFGAISAGPQSHFSGLLDDIRIYNRALTSIQIDSLFNEPNPILAGVHESLTKNIMNFYPNPATSSLHIETNQARDIIIMNLLGEVLIRETINQKANINLQHLPKGIYLLSDAEKNSIRKLIIQ